MSDIIDKAEEFKEDNFINILIEKIFNGNYINKYSIDIITVLIEYIRDIIFSEYIINILNALEDNNILTSLLIINENEELLSYEIIKEIKKEYLEKITINKNKKYLPKFMLNYKIPGFYNFYVELSKFISKSIFNEYSINETKLRKFIIGNEAEAKMIFDITESLLLYSVYQEIKNNKFIFRIIDKIPQNLLLNDYITFYLTKYNSDVFDFEGFLFDKFVIDDFSHKLINMLLNIRFNKKRKIVQDNDDSPIKLLLIKIIWIESNINYISKILKIYSILKNIFNERDDIYGYNDENESDKKLFELLEETLKEENLRYITNQKRNPIITTDVNECYYLLLASMCYSIIPPKVKLKDANIFYYFYFLKKALKIMQDLNVDLYIFLNEIYIIDELIKIYDILELNGKLKIELLIDISNILKKNNDIIQLNEEDAYDKLTKAFYDLYELIKKNLDNEDKGYYELLKYIFYKEIKKFLILIIREVLFLKIK